MQSTDSWTIGDILTRRMLLFQSSFDPASPGSGEIIQFAVFGMRRDLSSMPMKRVDINEVGFGHQT